nr:hypothetical protein [Tanacetum cinerariifolium]
TYRRDSHQSRGKSRSKSRGGRLKCYIFQSDDHLKRNCPKNNRKKSTCYTKKDKQPSSSGELNASVEGKDSLVQVWHKRLGHISKAGLHVLEKQGLFGKKSLGRHTTQGVIDYLHSDLWGSSQVELLGNKRYFLSIVDDYSRREFEQLCIESGIARHLTVVGAPQQNGVAERMNITFMDKTPYICFGALTVKVLMS